MFANKANPTSEERYWSLSLFELLSLAISIIGFTSALYSLYLLRQQTTSVAETLDVSSFQNIMNQQLELNKIFLDAPDFRPYFFDGVDITHDDANYTKAVAIADTYIDFLDNLSGQIGHLASVAGYTDDRIGRNAAQRTDMRLEYNAWMSYTYDSFRYSPVMCHRLAEVRLWYTSWFTGVAHEACQRHHRIEIPNVTNRNYEPYYTGEE